MDDKDRRIAELEQLCATLADKLADVCAKLKAMIEREQSLPCWRASHHLGRCGGRVEDAWGDK